MNPGERDAVPGCETRHNNNFEEVTEKFPEDELLKSLAELFKVFGEITRIKILYVLFQSERCVCEIADILDMTQSAISHQLRILKQTRLVKYRKEGKSVVYSLDDSHISEIFERGLTHLMEQQGQGGVL